MIFNELDEKITNSIFVDDCNFRIELFIDEYDIMSRLIWEDDKSPADNSNVIIKDIVFRVNSITGSGFNKDEVDNLIVNYFIKEIVNKYKYNIFIGEWFRDEII